MRLLVAVIAVAALGAAVGLQAETAPKPSDVPLSWNLQINLPGPLQAMQIKLPGSDVPQRFWYLRYTVTNRTGEDQVFVPDFVLYTDSGDILRAGKGVPTAVFEAIRKRYNNPLMLDMSAMSGPLRQGEDNAKDGVAIWPDFDPQAGAADVFIGGLSGETAEIKLPTPIEVTKTDLKGKTVTIKTDTVILSRTLQVHYEVSGEPSARVSQPARLVSKTWVMR